MSLIVDNSSIALDKSQALLHCGTKALLYPAVMTLGKRIKAARERLKNPEMTQAQLGDLFKISDKAVSSWERDRSTPEVEKLPAIAKALKVPIAWLLSGKLPVPPIDDPSVILEGLSEGEQQAVNAFISHLQQQRTRAV